MPACLHELYESLYERAKGDIDAVWPEVSMFEGKRKIVAVQALQDVEQGLPRRAHIHFCRLHGFDGCRGRVTDPC